MAVAYFTEQMARDENMGIEQIKSDAMDKALEDFMRNAMDPTGSRGSSGASSGGWINHYTSVG